MMARALLLYAHLTTRVLVSSEGHRMRDSFVYTLLFGLQIPHNLTEKTKTIPVSPPQVYQSRKGGRKFVVCSTPL